MVGAYVVVVFAFFRPALEAHAVINGMGTNVMEHRVFFDNTVFLLLLYGGYALNRLLVARKDRVLAGAALAAGALMLLVMQVRSFWGAFGIVVVLFVWSNRRALLRPPTVLAATLLIPAILGVVLATSAAGFEAGPWAGVKTSVADRFDSLVHFREVFVERSSKASTDLETLGTRVESARVVLDEFVLPNPLLGAGLGSELPLVNEAGQLVSTGFAMDNGYLLVLAKVGVVGFLLYGLVLLKVLHVLRRVLRSSSATDEERALAHSLFSGIVAALVVSGFSSVLVRQQTSIIAFLFILAEAAALRRSTQRRSREGMSRPAGYSQTQQRLWANFTGQTARADERTQGLAS